MNTCIPVAKKNFVYLHIFTHPNLSTYVVMRIASELGLTRTADVVINPLCTLSIL